MNGLEANMATHVAVKLMTAARQDHEPSLLALGKIYLEGGHGLPKHRDMAYHCLSRAAKLGSVEACRLMGDHIPADAVQLPRNAIPWYEAASATGSASAKLSLAELYLAETKAPRAPGRVRQLLTEAAVSGNPRAQWRLATLLLADEIDGTTDKPIRLLEQAAGAGFGQALLDLTSLLWERGEWDHWLAGAIPGKVALPPYDDTCAKAMYWFARLNGNSDNRQNPEDLYRYGVLLLNAQQTECAKWISLAARSGHARAQYLLGLLHMGPRYTPCPRGATAKKFATLRYKTAMGWHEKASRQGLVEATFAIHFLYGLRQFSQRDPSQANAFLKAAADCGHAEAQYHLARQLWLRSGKKVTVAIARLAQRSAEQGHPEARRLLDLLVSRVQATAAAEADRKAQAIQSVGQSDPEIAARMQLAATFGLSEREMLLLDVSKADCGDYFQIQFPWASGVYRRLVSIETAEQRMTLEKVTSLFNGNIVPSEVGSKFRSRNRRFRNLCDGLGIEWQHR